MCARRTFAEASPLAFDDHNADDGVTPGVDVERSHLADMRTGPEPGLFGEVPHRHCRR
jgi:hypothetical protein